MDWLTEYRPEILCISAGGIKGLEELGGVQYFYANGNLDGVHTYIGSSIGAIINTYLALEYSPRQILEVAVETSLFDDIADLKLTQIIHEYGLISNSSLDDNLARMMIKLIVQKMGKVPTLLEFYQFTKKRVVFCIVSMKENEEFFADHLSHPDMSLMVALRSTSNSPGVFGKLEHQKDFLLDGAVMNPLPILHLDDGVTEILAIGVEDKRDWNHTKISGIGYFDRVLSLPLKRLVELSIASSSSACYTVIIPVKTDMGMLDSAKDPNLRLNKFLSGYQFVEKYTASHPFKKRDVKKPGQVPLCHAVIKASIQSHACQVLLRCMKEDPKLFDDCMREEGIENPFSRSVESQVDIVKSPDRSQIVVSSPLEVVEMDANRSQIEPEIILELPRVFPQRSPFEFFEGFTPLQSGIPRSIHFEINLDELYEFMLSSVGRLAANSLKTIRK